MGVPPGVFLEIISIGYSISQVQIILLFLIFYAEKRLLNGWQLAKMKKSIPDMSLP